MGVWRAGCGRESWLVKQRRLGGETSGRALGAVGYQSGCLPKQALRFIINTVSYEAVGAARAAVPMAGSPREAGIGRWGQQRGRWEASAWLCTPCYPKCHSLCLHHGIPGSLKWTPDWSLVLQSLLIHSIFIKCLLFARSWREFCKAYYHSIC